MSEQTLHRYLVGYHTAVAPGLAFYTGFKSVYAETEEDACDRAHRELARTSFHDRGWSGIVIDSCKLTHRGTIEDEEDEG